MAKVLESFAFQNKQLGVSSYEKYLDGRIWEIDCRKDHPDCGSSMSVLASIVSRAKKRGMKVRSSGVRDNDFLTVQAYKPE